MNLNQIHNVYFIGIGGIGMSALARYFKAIGKNVSGYDKTPSTLTNDLIESGISIHFEDKIDLIPKDFFVENTLVIITPAVPIHHSEWNYFLERNYQVKKRAEVLGIITKDTFCLAVAGTHGKTTTSSILGHILYESGADVTAFLGGIVENYNSNLIGTGKTVTVVEADEFDRSFLHLHPNIACITSMDADHLDIYGDAKTIEASFVEFANKIEDKNNLFVINGLPLQGITCSASENLNESLDQIPSLNKRGVIHAFNIRIVEGWYLFDVKTPTEIIKDLKFGLPGKHNLTNALLALAMARTFGTPTESIAKALATFKGVKRRFSFQIREPDFVYIDDYAHHPTEIDAVNQAVRELYPNKKILAVFQPHLYSRTRDFADDFAKSLSQFDEILVLDIYPARELPIDGITSKWLVNKMENKNKKLVTKQELVSVLKSSDASVFITIGAGDIGELVPEIKKALQEKKLNSNFDRQH
jgi:UDP-N-acetylmuramate--alanine ligase